MIYNKSKIANGPNMGSAFYIEGSSISDGWLKSGPTDNWTRILTGFYTLILWVTLR